MFDELLGNSEQLQNQINENLKKIEIVEKLDGIEIKANGNKNILNLSIDDTLLNQDKKEQLEEQLSVVIERLMLKITQAEQEQSTKLIHDMMPGLGNLFGK